VGVVVVLAAELAACVSVNVLVSVFVPVPVGVASAPNTLLTWLFHALTVASGHLTILVI
jgi:hypothetical protein